MADSDLITAKDFAGQSSVWRQVLPMLDRVVRWLNTQQSSLGGAVVSFGENQRHALIAETAFRAAAAGFSSNEAAVGSFELAARDALRLLPRGEFAGDGLTYNERREAVKVCGKILRYVATLPEATFFSPVPGCGVVLGAYCDIKSGSELVEVKAVTRPFRGLDLRQLITYATMYYAKGETITHLTLLNPRRARYVTMSVETITQGASGRSAVEAMQDLVTAMVGLQVSA